MTVPRKAKAEAAEIAVQYLLWALEAIETTDNDTAARHARLALAALRTQQPGDGLAV
jgi:hypothetical protein